MDSHESTTSTNYQQVTVDVPARRYEAELEFWRGATGSTHCTYRSVGSACRFSAARTGLQSATCNGRVAFARNSTITTGTCFSRTGRYAMKRTAL